MTNENKMGQPGPVEALESEDIATRFQKLNASYEAGPKDPLFDAPLSYEGFADDERLRKYLKNAHFAIKQYAGRPLVVGPFDLGEKDMRDAWRASLPEDLHNEYNGSRLRLNGIQIPTGFLNSIVSRAKAIECTSPQIEAIADLYQRIVSIELVQENEYRNSSLEDRLKVVKEVDDIIYKFLQIVTEK